MPPAHPVICPAVWDLLKEVQPVSPLGQGEYVGVFTKQFCRGVNC